jgi:flagellar motility protein MotE (MotC chaperone)
MAKRNSAAGQLATLIMVFLGLNFLGALAFIGVLAATGSLTRENVEGIVRIVRGEGVSITRAQARQFRELLAEEEAREEARREEKGTGLVQAEALAAQENVVAMLRTEVEQMTERLQLEQQKNAELRQQIERVKREADEARERLAKAQEQRVTVRTAEKTERLSKTFAQMDAGDIATDLTAIARGDEADQEYAVQLLSLMKPNKVAEVWAEIPPGVRQPFIPLMLNEYANLEPQQVVAEWTRLGTTPRQMKEHLKSMPTTQALRVLRLLDRNTREDVWELIAPTQTAAR